MSDSLPPITWQLLTPSAVDSRPEPWLEELQSMRGRVLYHVCGLSEFRLADDTFADPDPVDTGAYHLLARSRTRVVGCVRAVSLAESVNSVGDSLLGRSGLEKLLLSIGATRRQTFEVSRWLVLPEHASANVAVRLIAGMWAVLRWLGTQKAIGMAGTRDGQDRLLRRLGGQRIPGLLPIISPRFEQTIVALWFDLFHPPSQCAALIDEMSLTLKLHAHMSHLAAQPVTDTVQSDGDSFGATYRDKHTDESVLSEQTT